MKKYPLSGSQILQILAGSLLFVLSVSWFITPLHLYTGGIIGLAQLLRTLFFSAGSFDASGLINFVFNVPLFILAYKSMNERVLFGTLISLAVQTIAFSLIPIPAQPILNDTLACIIIGAVLGGIGCGVVLSGGATAGGLDLLGLYMSQKQPDFSVGRLSMLFNSFLYVACAVLFSLSTALYSAIYIVIFSLAVDKYHYQNIEMELMVFTHHPEIKEKIMHKYVRGVTCWKGLGAYTGNETEVFVTVVAKSEVNQVKKDIQDMDPDAFIIVHEGARVTGGYQKRLY